MSNPVTDLLAFLTGTAGDFGALGGWTFVVMLVFYGLIAGSLWFAVANWREDPTQRDGTTLWLWAVRVLIGCMWFQGTLWKLPFGMNNGLYYWTQQMAGRAAFAIQADLVKEVILPNFWLVNPLVYLAELFFAAALILGLVVRFAGTAAALFTVNLWLGIYNKRPGDPDEWSWSYMFLIVLCGSFAGAGRRPVAGRRCLAPPQRDGRPGAPRLGRAGPPPVLRAGAKADAAHPAPQGSHRPLGLPARRPPARGAAAAGAARRPGAVRVHPGPRRRHRPPPPPHG